MTYLPSKHPAVETYRAFALARAHQLDTERDGSHLPPLVCVVQTCCACLSQWDAWDAAGQYYYLRYRSARGTVETCDSASTYGEEGSAPPELVANFNYGEPLDGEISLAGFLQRAGMRLAEDATVRPCHG